MELAGGSRLGAKTAEVRYTQPEAHFMLSNARTHRRKLSPG